MAEFDISIKRVKKIPVPLLVIGLGGTGCDVLRTVKQVFAERYVLPTTAEGKTLPAPAKTAYLGVDSLSTRPDGLEVNEYVDISLGGMDKILTNQSELLTAYERTWVNHSLRHESGGMGMGTVRQAARLALSRNYSKVRQAIKGSLNQIVSANLGDVPTNVKQYEIVIITGIGGGTGSGTFLDMAQIVRSAAKEASVLPAKITGYIVMPDVSLSNVTAASGMEGPIKHNAYAALKELDFWMRVKEHETPYSMKYGTASDTPIEWKEPPFDYCVLMSCSNVKGVPYKNSYMTVRKTIAENLMHYLAEEDGATEQYSYRQYEDNLSAIPVEKTYPLNYSYRSIGAFTKRIPKKPILYYEGSKLLDTFIPMRDMDGILQPDRSMFTDGHGSERAQKITGNGKQMLQDFATSKCRLPDFCNMDLNDKAKVGIVQDLSPAPHERWMKWRDNACIPAAHDAAEKYLSDAWERFSKFVEYVFSKPELGPFALEKYLEESTGLLKDLNTVLDGWKSRQNNIRVNGLHQAEEMCSNTWPAFCNPPLLGRGKALEQYDIAIKTLYNTVRENEFLVAHIEALERLILRVNEYLRDGLKPMTGSVLFLEKEFDAVETDDTVLAQNIYDLSTVQRTIDDAFETVNQADALSSRFLKDLTEISLECRKSVDARTSGVEFTCRSNGLNNMCHSVQRILEETCGSVNSQSLDDIMLQQVGESEEAQHKWMDDLAESALDSAYPMFKMDPIFQHEKPAPYSYMSIPQNAKKHVAYLSESFKAHESHVTPKASTLDDHIYCLMAYDKMPLYRYADIEELRRQYEADLTAANALGVHLVYTGEPNATFREDWSLLPSPKPFFLFPQNGVLPENENRTYQKVHDLTQRAIACGMVTVRDNESYAAAAVRVHYANAVAMLTAKDMLDNAEAIKAQRNPATGDVFARNEQCEKLQQYLENATVVPLSEGEVSPSTLAAILHLENQPCDPFDPGIQGDTVRLAIAKENHKKLCVVMVEAMIYRRPDLIQALELQVPAYESITAFINAGVGAKKIWEKRTAYAETAAEMFIYLKDILTFSMNGYRYKVKGEKYDVITPALLAEDLRKVESDVLKTAAFLADVDPQNAARAELENRLRLTKADLNEQFENEELTMDDLQDYMDAAADFRKDAEETRDALVREGRLNPGKADELEGPTDMLEELIRVTSSVERTFKKMARSLK